MIIAPSHGFVLLSVPKVASTSLDAGARATYHQEPPGRQRLPSTRTVVQLPPPHACPRSERTRVIERDRYEVVALFRDPVAWLESWWRYRQRPDVRDNQAERYTGERSFAEFVELFLTRQGRHGHQGSPGAGSSPATPTAGARLDRIFAVDRPEVWTAWFAERVGSPLDGPAAQPGLGARPDRAVPLRPGQPSCGAWFAAGVRRHRAPG